MKRRSKTLATSVDYEGIGLHSGLPSKMSLIPAPGRGIYFLRTDFPNAIPTRLSPLSYSSSERCSVVGHGQDSVSTIEHLLAVFFVYCITDVLVEVSSSELPEAGGSARVFSDLVLSAGVIETGESIPVFSPSQKIVLQANGAEIIAEPCERLEVSYFLDLERHGLCTQQVNYCIDVETFYNQIAPARTFAPAVEAQMLLDLGFGRGASSQNTLLLGKPESVELVDNEAATHKVLDLLGDICALGLPVNARICASRSGHKLNNMLLAEFAKEITNSNREI